MEPKPFQKPHPPLWFGGAHAAALRRAVELGDGFMGAGSQTTAEFAEQVRILRETLAERDAEKAAFRIAKRVYIAVDSDGPRARRRLTEGLTALYGFFGIPGLETLGTGGTPGECIAALREVSDAGAEMILLNPLIDDLDQMERLAAEVMPAL